ncbi:C40 family peptidase [Micromonospora sp. GCM10011541]|uniref:C40 family peptidase n=1 Tax=Micromonospora TaxID=1873 RepID=UPI0036107D11
MALCISTLTGRTRYDWPSTSPTTVPHLGDRNDHDSIGVFQQRPSQAWGRRRPTVRTRLPGREVLRQAAHRSRLGVDAAHPGRPGSPSLSPPDRIREVDRRRPTPSGAAHQHPHRLRKRRARRPPERVRSTHRHPARRHNRHLLGPEPTRHPYHFGGSCTDPHSDDPARQCDCSSLMQSAYRAAGISIPRVTADQVKAGQPVNDQALMLPGDLVLIPGSEAACLTLVTSACTSARASSSTPRRPAASSRSPG